MIKNLLLALTLIPSLALGASDFRTEPEEMLFEKGIAFTRRDESSGATLNAMATSSTYVKLSSVVSTINGMAAPADGLPKIVIVSNMTGAPVTFVHEEAAATAENRFDLPDGEDLRIQDRESATFIYDHGADRWVSAGGSSSGSGTGAVNEVAQASHGFSVGDVLYYDGSGYALALADDLASAEVLGVVSEVADANSFLLTTVGYIEGLSGLIPGGTYYLSDSVAGQLTATEPTTVDHVSKPVLVAVSATTGYVIHSRGAIIMEAAPDMPMVNKGELYGFDGTDPIATPVCSDDQVLIADASQPSGWICGTPASTADGIAYSPTTSGDWQVPPVNVEEALDELADRASNIPQNPKNYVVNPGAEDDATTGVTATNTTVSRNTTSPILGAADFSFTIDSATDVVEFALEPFDAGLKNDICEVSARFYASANGENVQAQLYRNGVAVGSKNLWTNMDPQEFGIYAPCGDLTNTTTLRIVGTAAATTAIKIDDLQVTKMRGISRAQVNATWVGGITYSVDGSNQFTGTSAGWNNFPAYSGAAAAARGSVSAPATKVPAVTVHDVDPNSQYQFVITGSPGTAGTHPYCNFRISDGTDTSGEGTIGTYNAADVRVPNMEFLVSPTSAGTKTYNLQYQIQNGTSCFVNLTYTGLRIDVYKIPKDAAVLTAAAKRGDFDWTVVANPTITATGSAPTLPTASYQRYQVKKVGDTGYFRYTFAHTSGAGGAEGSGTYLFSLPAGYEFDSSVPTGGGSVGLSSSGVNRLPTTSGVIAFNSGGEQNLEVTVFAYDSTKFFIVETYGGSAISTQFGSAKGLMTRGSGATIDVTFSAKIKGWTQSATTANITGEPGVWAGTHGANCSAWSVTSGSPIDPPGDSTCTFTELKNTNFGTVTSAITGSDKLPGITFTPKLTGDFMACAFGDIGNNNTAYTYATFYDGSNTKIGGTVAAYTTSNQQVAPFSTCAAFSTVAGVSKTVKLKTHVSGGIGNLNASGAELGWVIYPITQNLPGLFGGSSTNNTKWVGFGGASGMTSSCGSGPCTIHGQNPANWVSSVTRNGAGDYSVNLSTAFPSTPICTTQPYNSSRSCRISNTTTTSKIDLLCDMNGGVADLAIAMSCYAQ